MKKLILLDSHALIHRAYHALPPLTTSAGEPAGAVYGFTVILLRILREMKPDYIAAAFDLPGPTFRHIAYERYKATRPETPGDLASQFAKVREVLEAFRVPIFSQEGYEADDIIGTIAEEMKKNKKTRMVIVTGDADALQLVRPGVSVLALKKGISDTAMYDTAAVKNRYGFGPQLLVDFKGLKGDPSDNIPGVKGIGEKTATDLVRAFGSLENIYRAVKKKDKKMSAAVLERLRSGEEDAKFSRELAMIHTGVPIDFDLEKTAWRGGMDSAAVLALFQKFGFASLIRRMTLPEEKKGRAQPQAPAQATLLMSTAADAPKKISSVAHIKKYGSSARRDGRHGARVGAFVRDDAVICILNDREKPRIFALDKNLLSEKTARDFFAEQKNLYAHDAKSLIHFFREQGAPDISVRFDVLLASWLVGGLSRDFSLPAIVAREAPSSRGIAEDFFAAARSLDAKLNEGNLRFVFESIEMPLPPVLARMEARGILLDRAFLAALGEKVGGELAGLTTVIHAAAGESFNINSPSQLSRILFEKLGIAAAGLRKTDKGGVVSTRESELVKLKRLHPIVDDILKYRELAKLQSTYIEALPETADKKTNRLHTTFNQAGTATGRLSSASPNLQNIPVMSDVGREIRKAFVAQKGFVLASFDYSQIELRVAAHLSGDAKMIEAFRKGTDIHALTASEIYHVPLDQVTPPLRRAAKTLNFGVLYGMGASAFAEGAGMSREDAKKFIDEYFRDFSGVRDYIERTKARVREHGFVETLFGRRRFVPEIMSSNPRIRSEAERMAVNMPIQGSATGDIVKLAMIGVDNLIKKERLADDARMLLQVHDELVFEIKKERVPEVAAKIKNIMEHAADLSVPLVVDVKAGPNWGEQKPFEPHEVRG